MYKEPIESLIDDMSTFLSSRLRSLGINRYPVDQDDLLQEIRIRIWKAYKNYNGEIKFLNAYIKKVIYSVFINEVNRIKKETRILESGKQEYLINESKEVEESNSSEILKCCLIKILASIRKEQSEIIKLRLEGISIGDIARIKGWSYRKTCNTLYRGINIVKKRLKEEGYRYED